LRITPVERCDHVDWLPSLFYSCILMVQKSEEKTTWDLVGNTLPETSITPENRPPQ